MASDLLQLARARYRGIISDDCFVVEVPDWLQLTPDHTIAPSFQLQTEDGVKWTKVSQYDEFHRSCKAAFMDVHEEKKLNVIIMPYMPLSDAYKLHQLITNPEILPSSFPESLEYLKLKEDAQSNGEAGDADQGLVNLFCEDEGEQEWEMREGSVTFQDVGFTVPFTVINYSVLWSKAEKYCILNFMRYPMDTILDLLNRCEQLLYSPAASTLPELQAAVDRSKKQLIMTMYQKSEDPHDAILALFPELHTAIYQQDCVHCDPEVAEVDEEDSQETLARLWNALVDNGFEENYVEMSVDKVKKQLMFDQGCLEIVTHQVQAMNAFIDAQHNFRNAVQPIVHDLSLAGRRPSVIGVSAMDLYDDA